MKERIVVAGAYSIDERGEERRKRFENKLLDAALDPRRRRLRGSLRTAKRRQREERVWHGFEHGVTTAHETPALSLMVAALAIAANWRTKRLKKRDDLRRRRQIGTTREPPSLVQLLDVYSDIRDGNV